MGISVGVVQKMERNDVGGGPRVATRLELTCKRSDDVPSRGGCRTRESGGEGLLDRVRLHRRLRARRGGDCVEFVPLTLAFRGVYGLPGRVRISVFPRCFLVGRPGLEPGTYGLKDSLESRRIVGVTSPMLLDECGHVLKMPEIRTMASLPLDDDLIERAVRYIGERFTVVPGDFQVESRVGL